MMDKDGTQTPGRSHVLAKAQKADMPGYVYVGIGNPYWHGEETRTFYKIGSTNKHNGRFSYAIEEMTHIITCENRANAYQLEAHFHRVFERMKLVVWKEWFDLTPEAMEYLTSFSSTTVRQVAGLRRTEINRIFLPDTVNE